MYLLMNYINPPQTATYQNRTPYKQNDKPIPWAILSMALGHQQMQCRVIQAGIVLSNVSHKAAL